MQYNNDNKINLWIHPQGIEFFIFLLGNFAAILTERLKLQAYITAVTTAKYEAYSPQHTCCYFITVQCKEVKSHFSSHWDHRWHWHQQRHAAIMTHKRKV